MHGKMNRSIVYLLCQRILPVTIFINSVIEIEYMQCNYKFTNLLCLISSFSNLYICIISVCKPLFFPASDALTNHSF